MDKWQYHSHQTGFVHDNIKSSKKFFLFWDLYFGPRNQYCIDIYVMTSCGTLLCRQLWCDTARHVVCYYDDMNSVEWNMASSNPVIRDLPKHYGKKGLDVFAAANDIEGEGTVDDRTARKWFRRFKFGEANIEDKPWSGGTFINHWWWSSASSCWKQSESLHLSAHHGPSQSTIVRRSDSASVSLDMTPEPPTPASPETLLMSLNPTAKPEELLTRPYSQDADQGQLSNARSDQSPSS